MGNKSLLLSLALVFSIFVGGEAFASNAFDDASSSSDSGSSGGGGGSGSSIEAVCAQQYGFHYGLDEKRPADSAIIQQYNNCVSENYRTRQEQANAPANPGSAPVYNCEQYNMAVTQTKYEQCKATYEGDKATYNANLANYQNYMAGHPNINTVKELSAAQVLEDIAAKQQASADRLKSTASTVRNLGIALGIIGAGLMMWLVTTPAGKICVATGLGLTLIAMVIQGKADKIAREKIESCASLNKILTKPMSCDDVKQQTAIDGTFTATNFGSGGTTGTSEIPAFIDSTTGKCKSPVTAECAVLVKNAPKDCFKANSKGLSCMAGIKTPSPITVLANGKVSANINGKQRAFGSEDFADEASMVKAGFTKDQAKQFLSMVNSPDSILAKNGLNAKGELIKGAVIPTTNLTKPSSSVTGDGTSGTAGMKSKKDEYGPVQEVARTPASAEGLTKDYHGDTIGAEGDDVFKMINRRYNLKQKQNIFLEQ